MDFIEDDDEFGVYPAMHEWTPAQPATGSLASALGIVIPVMTKRQERLERLQEREMMRRRQMAGEGVMVAPAGALATPVGAGARGRYGGGPGLSLSTPKASFGGPSARASTFFAGQAGNQRYTGELISSPGEHDHDAEPAHVPATSIFQQTEEGVAIPITDDRADIQSPVGSQNLDAHGVSTVTTTTTTAAAASTAAATALEADAAGLGGMGMGASAGYYDPTPQLASVMDVSNPRRFVQTPAPKGMVVQCRIRRHKSGTKRMFPTYELYLESPETFLLAARKRKKSRSSNYLISLDASDMQRDSANYIGKVRSNFLGTQFTVYSAGEAPGKAQPGQDVRSQLCGIRYESNFLGFKGPRKMCVLIPAMRKDGVPHVCRPESNDDGLLQRYKREERQEMLVLGNKTPVWNEASQSYVLNFSKRVTQASVKNYQIIHEDQPNYIVSQFGRVSDHEFTMDFRYPMTALQAFGIALTSFDGKLACE